MGYKIKYRKDKIGYNMSELYMVYIRGISGTSVSDLLRYIASRSVGIFFIS